MFFHVLYNFGVENPNLLHRFTAKIGGNWGNPKEGRRGNVGSTRVEGREHKRS